MIVCLMWMKNGKGGCKRHKHSTSYVTVYDIIFIKKRKKKK